MLLLSIVFVCGALLAYTAYESEKVHRQMSFGREVDSRTELKIQFLVLLFVAVIAVLGCCIFYAVVY